MSQHQNLIWNFANKEVLFLLEGVVTSSLLLAHPLTMTGTVQTQIMLKRTGPHHYLPLTYVNLQLAY